MQPDKTKGRDGKPLPPDNGGYAVRSALAAVCSDLGRLVKFSREIEIDVTHLLEFQSGGKLPDDAMQRLVARFYGPQAAWSAASQSFDRYARALPVQTDRTVSDVMPRQPVNALGSPAGLVHTKPERPIDMKAPIAGSQADRLAEQERRKFRQNLQAARQAERDRNNAAHEAYRRRSERELAPAAGDASRRANDAVGEAYRRNRAKEAAI